jgi:hypothetical protein
VTWMNIKVMNEAGYDEALVGLSLSYNSKPSPIVAFSLSKKEGGHNKFLETMQVWLDIDAPRYWWAQMDTYRVGITKQSESTMHTLMMHELRQSDFQGGIDLRILDILNKWRDIGSFTQLKAHLPESFLQRRIVCVNYKTLRNICKQRATHRLAEWQLFIGCLLDQLEHPEFLGVTNDDLKPTDKRTS